MGWHTRGAVLLALAIASAPAQWLNYPAPGTPRHPDGKPNLGAPAPRDSKGKPDLSGVWQVEPTPPEELTQLFGAGLTSLSVPGDDPRSLSKYAINILSDFKPQEAPIRPEALELLRQRAQGGGRDIPTSRCLPGGMPFIYLLPTAFKIIQTPGLIAVVHEGDSTFRQIYTDGRKHPRDPQPLWMGYSVGRWDAETLVVDTVGFNDKSWLDAFGHPHSEALHLTERIRRRDFGHLDFQVTVEDPKMYTRPFTIRFAEHLLADTDILESICAENEKDLAHLAQH